MMTKYDPVRKVCIIIKIHTLKEILRKECKSSVNGWVGLGRESLVSSQPSLPLELHHMESHHLTA